MASGFIIRPFGTKPVRRGDGTTDELDFDRVERELIQPAFSKAGIDGGTTAEIARAGNIRTDMFELLAVADAVVADISMHNANVFYELGARHALRTQVTVMIRCRSEEVPFDLRTDRYLEYDADAPGNAVDALAQALRDSLASSVRDSPIFALLPALDPPSVSHLSPVPPEFQDAVRRSAATGDIGQLVLLGEEVSGRTWAAEASRLVARELFKQKRWPESLRLLEHLRTLSAEDSEADLKLATVYQRLKRLADSDSAIARALARRNLSARESAEALSLQASNKKARWLAELGDASIADEEHLGYAHLAKAFELYRHGFQCDLNHFYSGLNAYALLSVLLELARQHPNWWNNNHDDETAAARALEDLQSDRDSLRGAVNLSVRRGMHEAQGDDALWAAISRADCLFLSAAAGQDARVVEAYRKALTGAGELAFEAVARQLDLYARLGVFAERVAEVRAKILPLAPLSEAKVQKRWIVFAGHRVDAVGRPRPRFPATAEAEAKARAAIEAKVRGLREAYPGTEFIGLAGAANGGDILFHEVCAAQNVANWVYLAIPEAEYIERSVRHASEEEWVRRFRKIVEGCAERKRQLADDARLPSWMSGANADYIWERNNRWLLYAALAEGAKNVHLLVLWDGLMEGDGSGGTHHMVQVARESGAEITCIETPKLFGLP